MLNLALQVLFVATVPLFCLLLWQLVNAKRIGPSTLWLALLLGSRIFAEGVEFFKVSGLADNRTLFRLNLPFILSGAPLVYLYFRASLAPCIAPCRVSPVHFVPFVFGWLYYLGFKIWAPEEYFSYSESFYSERYIRMVIRSTIAIPYMYLIWKIFQRASEKLMLARSESKRARIRWLKYLWAICILASSFTVFDVLGGPNLPIWVIDAAINFVALFGLIMIGLSTSRVVEGCDIEMNSEHDVQDLEKLKAALMQKLAGEKMYLTPRLRLQDLAEALNLRPQKVSDVINHGFGKTFYDLVNELRVTEAKRRILENSEEKMLSIGLDCGFTSKSTFNEVFRRIAGMTPREYKRFEKAKNGSRRARSDELPLQNA